MAIVCVVVVVGVRVLLGGTSEFTGDTQRIEERVPRWRDLDILLLPRLAPPPADEALALVCIAVDVAPMRLGGVRGGGAWPARQRTLSLTKPYRV